VSIDDEVGAIVFLLTADVSGPVNITAPNPVTNAEFTRVLGTVLRRPTALPIPKFAPKLLLGSEMAETLLFSGQRVMPRKLTAAGYEFRDPQLEGALRRLLEKPAA
jgi:NAD dependent epimerase/dehydratase family enzyme